MAKNKGGRPSKYTPELAERICLAISNSTKGLHSICKENSGFPCSDTIFTWLKDHKEFSEQYARAREIQADLLATEILEIADDSSNDTLVTDKGREYENKEWTNRSRLRVDSRKWLASKLAPKKYGDKLDVTSDGEKLQQTVITYIPDNGRT